MITPSKIFNFVLGFVFVVSTMFFRAVNQDFQGNPIEYLYNIQESFFRYGAFAVFGIGCLMVHRRQFKDRIFPIFVIYVLFTSLIISMDLSARRSLLNIFTALIFYYSVVSYLDASKTNLLINLAALILIINGIMCAFQVFGIDPVFQHIRPDLIPKSDPTGMMKLPAHLGTITAILFPLVAYLTPLSIPLCLILIWFSKSSVAVVSVALTFGFLIYPMFRNKKLFWISSLLVLVLSGLYVFLYDMPTGQFLERPKVWFFAFSHVLKSNPFIGLGISSFAKTNVMTIQNNGEPIQWIWVHNEFIQAFFEFGAFGVALIFMWIKERFKEFSKFSHNMEYRAWISSLFSILFCSLINFPFHLGRFSVVMLTVMAVNKVLYEHFSMLKNEEVHEEKAAYYHPCLRNI